MILNNFIDDEYDKCIRKRYTDISFATITPYLINIMTNHIEQYINIIQKENVKLIDFGCGTGFLSKVLDNEFNKLNLNIEIISYDKIKESDSKSYVNNIIDNYNFLLHNIFKNDILLISWGHALNNTVFERNFQSLYDPEYHTDINKILDNCKPRLVIIIGENINESTLPFNFLKMKYDEYIDYFVEDSGHNWKSSGINEKISFNLNH